MTPPREPLQMSAYSPHISRRLLSPVIQSWCQRFRGSEIPTPVVGLWRDNQEVRGSLNISLSTAWILGSSLQMWRNSCIISRNKLLQQWIHTILGHDRMSNDYYSTGVSYGGQNKDRLHSQNINTRCPKNFHLLLVIVAVSESFLGGHPIDVPLLNIMGHTL